MYKLIDQTREKDGVIIPHIIRQIDCNPAAPINLLIENAPFKETNDLGAEQALLNQFQNDTKNVPDYQKPDRIVKYVNTVQ